MKFSLTKSKFSQALQSVLQVVPNKTTLPILSNILVEALEGKLKLSATDLDMSISASVDATVSRKGSVAVPARILSEIVRELPEAELHVESTANRVELKIPNGSYKIASVSPDDFPKLPVINSKKEVKVGGEELVKMIRKTTFACSTDETRPALNGVLWQQKGEKMIMVATDGHRLARVASTNAKLKGVTEDLIIPPKVLNLIPKFVDAAKEKEIGVIFGDNSIIFNLGETVLTSRLLEGPYPNFEQVIPQTADKKLTINREELAGAVRRVSILSNALTHQVRFSIKKGSVTLSTNNADVGGEGRETLNCDFVGEALELGYNAIYIQEILGKIEGAEVSFDLSSPVAAGVIYSPLMSREDFLCLVMPLRLAD